MSPAGKATEVLKAVLFDSSHSVELEKFRRHVTIFFSDIQGSTAYFERYGDAAGLSMVYRCNEMQREIVQRHRGAVVKTIGDAVMARFDHTTDAVDAAIEIQRTLAAKNARAPEPEQVWVRVGINSGTGIVKSDDVYGDVVNVASRVQSTATAKQIAVSQTAWAEIVDTKLYRVRETGKHSFKGKSAEQDVYLLEWEQVVRAEPVYKPMMLREVGLGRGQCHSLRQGALRVGRTEGNLRFPQDLQMYPLHAEIVAERDHILVRPLAEGAAIFVRLTGVHTLTDGDVIKLGQRMFRFREEKGVVAAAANAGATVIQMEQLLKQSVAELISEQNPAETFPVSGLEISFGRTRGTYRFPTDAYMSRAHAKIYQRGENFFLEDLGSSNGSFLRVNTESVVPLQGQVMVGSQVFELAVESESAQPSSSAAAGH